MQIFEFSPPIVFHKILNPKLWTHADTLDRAVQVKLLETARAFIRTLELKDIPLTDIVITGSNCNFTYTRHSDLDLHIRMDLDSLGERDLVDELVQSKKALWNERHDIKLRGIPVEVYVEDDDQHVEGSVYSLLKDKWLQQIPLTKTQYDDVSVRAKFKDWSQRIERALDTAERPEELAKLRDRLRTYRKNGLSSRGEFSTENLTFKALRNEGLLDRLQQKRYELTSRQLSLPEQQR